MTRIIGKCLPFSTVYSALNHNKRIWISTMKPISPALVSTYKAMLAQNRIADRYQHHYVKWLRYYLDFCSKYNFDASNPKSLPNFIEKLKEKNQTGTSQKQAHSAIRIYYFFIQTQSGHSKRESRIRPKNHDAAKEHQHPFIASSALHEQQPGSKSHKPNLTKTDVYKSGNEKRIALFPCLSESYRI